MQIEMNGKIIEGRVCEIQREHYKVLCELGEVETRLKGTFYKEETEYPVIGDFVRMKYNAYGDSMLEKVMERKSVFVRPDRSGHAEGYVKNLKSEVMAANFDYVFIVMSLNQNFNLNRVTRYVAVALQGGGKPVVILTKADLCEDKETYRRQVLEVSDQVTVYVVSALTGEGMDQLDGYMKKGNTIVLLGSSGVGKSTLVNYLAGKEIMKVSSVREKDDRGRHTTTHRQLLVLPNGVTIIDTPGIRELGIFDAQEGIDTTFEDIVELTSHCKFSNCSHRKELGCAVQEALLNGMLSEERWIVYQKMQKENEWGLKKAAKLERMNKKKKK